MLTSRGSSTKDLVNVEIVSCSQDFDETLKYLKLNNLGITSRGEGWFYWTRQDEIMTWGPIDLEISVVHTQWVSVFVNHADNIKIKLNIKLLERWDIKCSKDQWYSRHVQRLRRHFINIHKPDIGTELLLALPNRMSINSFVNYWVDLFEKYLMPFFNATTIHSWVLFRFLQHLIQDPDQICNKMW